MFKQGEQLAEQGRAREGRSSVPARRPRVPEGGALGAGGGQRRGRGQARRLISRPSRAPPHCSIQHHKSRRGGRPGRVDRRDDVPGSRPVQRSGGLSRDACGQLAQERAPQGRRLQRGAPACDGGRARQKAIDSGDKFQRALPARRAHRRGDLLDGQGPREGGQEEGGRGALRSLLAERAQRGRAGRGAGSPRHRAARATSVAARRRSTARSRSTRSERTSSVRSRQVLRRPRLATCRARPSSSSYEAVKIEGDVKQLKERLKKKSELLKKAAETFLGTAEMGVAEWTTAALYQIGFTYESFSKALLNSPPPADLSSERRRSSTRNRSRSSSCRSRSAASRPTRAAGRRPSSSGSSTNGPPRCARRSVA